MEKKIYRIRRPLTTCEVVRRRDALGIKGSMNRVNILENPEQYEILLARAAEFYRKNVIYLGVINGVRTYRLKAQR